MRIGSSLAAIVVVLTLSGMLIAAPRSPRASRPASRQAATASATQAATTPASRPLDPKANLTLEQIEPRLSLQRAATGPATKPSIDALVLYARARDAMLDRNRAGAIDLVQRAIALDPDSSELHHSLAQLYVNSSVPGAGDKALAALERAVELCPDDCSQQLHLAQQYLRARNLDKALMHLRTAVLTTDYRKYPSEAAQVDWLLARLLRQQGYTRAAAEEYALLLRRLEHPRYVIRGNPELTQVYGLIGVLYLEVGDLYRELGDRDEALRYYRTAATRSATDEDMQGRLTRAVMKIGHGDEARTMALAAVGRTHGSPRSVELLREVLKSGGHEANIVAELKRLVDAKPDDRMLLLGLANALVADGRDEDAIDRLTTAIRPNKVQDIELVKRVVELCAGRRDAARAARILIEYTATCPEATEDLRTVWSALARPGQPARLRLPMLQKIEVAPQAQAAKLYWMAIYADNWARESAAKTYLNQAIAVRPPFAPAFRSVLLSYLMRPDFSETQRDEEANKLIESVRPVDPGLAMALRGVWLIAQKKQDEAQNAFLQAIRLGHNSPQVLISWAASLMQSNQEQRAEQVLWKAISDYPTCEEAFQMLFRLYLDRQAAREALGILERWLSADPRSVSARLLEAAVHAKPDPQKSRDIILKLYNEDSQNAEVIIALQRAYAQAGKEDEFMGMMEREQAKHPFNRPVVELLVTTWVPQRKIEQATRVIDGLHKSVSEDPDLLYYAAHLYERVDKKAACEEVLEQVLKLEPKHPAASNDLGYMWADEGRNLDRAEVLIRYAVEAEPDNVAFLDSAGWIFYKRSKFQEAHKYLQQAVGRAMQPDAVILDHLADTLYRLGQVDEAVKLWNRALENVKKIESPRTELAQLRQNVEEKLRQHTRGEPVKIAPVVEQPTTAATRP